MIRIPSPLPNPLPVPLPAWAATGYGLGYVMQDPDAAAYVAAVKAAGVDDAHLASLGMPSWSVSEPAIDAFVLAEKAASRWALIKRLYFPVWGVASANAICIRSLTSGQFIGGVTHAAGSVIGNGSTGYFDLGVNATTLGQTNADFHFWHGNLQTPASSNRLFFGAIDGSAIVLHGSYVSPTSGFRTTRFSGVRDSFITMALADRVGIFLTSRDGGNDYTTQCRASGCTLALDVAIAAGGTVPATRNYYALAANNGGSPLVPTTSPMMGWGVGMALTKANANAYTTALKTLWETCTGLSLP